MQPNFHIQLIDQMHAELHCNNCKQARRMERMQLKALVANGLFHENCPSCASPYYDWSPAPVAEVLDNEFTRLGQTVQAVMKHRNQVAAAELEANIGFILLDKEQRLGLPAFTPAERRVYAVQSLLREVNNGGFAQFFASASSALRHDLLPALRAMGSSITLQGIVEQALHRCGPTQALDDLPRDLWDDLDDAFYALEEDETKRLIDYIAAQPDQFPN